MNVDFSQIENLLISEIKLSSVQARIFLLVVTHGRMNAENIAKQLEICLLYTSPSPRDGLLSRMPSSA